MKECAEDYMQPKSKDFGAKIPWVVGGKSHLNALGFGAGTISRSFHFVGNPTEGDFFPCSAEVTMAPLLVVHPEVSS